jgi:CubicO group peptidase (beta-lactamase class C family)
MTRLHKIGGGMAVLSLLLLLLAVPAAEAQRAKGDAPATTPSLAKGTPQSVGLAGSRLARITATFKKETDEKRLPGAVVMVARKGKLVYAEAFGLQDPKGTAPMRTDTIFRIYSMTKPLVSVAAMLLVEDGVVQLTDPVSKFIPSLKEVKVSAASGDVAPERAMTVQDLLRHTAGLAYGELTKNEKVKADLVKAGFAKPGVIDFDSRDMTGPEQGERIGKIALIHQPASVWEYSLASDILGRVVEAASGKRLGDFLSERVFVPLSMTDTGFFVPEAKKSRLAEPFDKDPATGTQSKLIDVSKQPGNDSGGAGAVSTAMDYLRFSQMLLSGGKLEERRVMSRSTIRLMTSDHLSTIVSNPQMPGELVLGSKGYTFGLGFAVRMQNGIAGLPGSAGDYTWAGYAGTYFWVDPVEQIAAVFMSQAPSPARAYYRRLVRQLVYQAIVD